MILRALALDHEMLRVVQQLGIVDAVLPFTEPFTPSEWFGADGQLIRCITMVAPPWPPGDTPSIVFTRPPVERVLRDCVTKRPHVQVALGTTMTGLGSCSTLQLDGCSQEAIARLRCVSSGSEPAIHLHGIQTLNVSSE